MITSITIKGKEIQRKGFEVDFSKDFDKFILEQLDDYDIKSYAEDYLDMLSEGECDCEIFDIQDEPDLVLIKETKRRGFIIIETKSITEHLHLQEVLPRIVKAL